MNAARERLNLLIEGEATAETRDKLELVQAKALIEKAERHMDGANADDREDLVNGIEVVKDALQSSDADALKQATDELSELIFYLES